MLTSQMGIMIHHVTGLDRGELVMVVSDGAYARDVNEDAWDSIFQTVTDLRRKLILKNVSHENTDADDGQI